MYRSIVIVTAVIAALALPNASPAATHHRLPKGYKWGRCLLRVDGKSYITGRCSYHVEADGSFDINGPDQIYPGIDYSLSSDAAGGGARSNDYIGEVQMEGSSAQGFWNEEPLASHVQGTLGTLKRQGACWVNKRARICLWRR